MSGAPFGPADLLRTVVALGAVCAASHAMPALGFCALGFGVLAAPFALARAAWSAWRGVDDPTRTVRWWATRGVALALALVGAGTGIERSVDDGERRAAPVIAALAQFHAREHRYPAQLAELVPRDLAALPAGVSDGFSMDGVMYHPAPARPPELDSYTLTLVPVTGLPIKHSYSPRSGKWMTWD